MSGSFYFAGGGTGGHIYPALAVAEKIKKLQPTSKCHFFVSTRDIDSAILSKTDFEFTQLPAIGFSLHPAKMIRFFKTFTASYKQAKAMLSEADYPCVIGIGGFVAAPVCYAAHILKMPVKLINVDIVPGKANKLIYRWANEVFVQFPEAAEFFQRKKKKVTVTGCPLRSSFDNPYPQKAVAELGLDSNKKILLVTGASSGAKSINDTIIALLENLEAYSDTWQIVHLTGIANIDDVTKAYRRAKIRYRLIDYYDNMADLLSAADLLIGRSGAVSVAEFAACSVPSLCMPYPHHKDLHQYRNAGKLVEKGAAIIVDDLPDFTDRKEWLWEELEPLLKNPDQLKDMKRACAEVANRTAAQIIAQQLIKS